LIQRVLRFIAQRPGRMCRYLPVGTVTISGTGPANEEKAL
jgi:hypothetical protein